VDLYHAYHALGISYFFTFLFICPGKPDHYWSTLLDEATDCIDVGMVHASYSTTNVILDLLILLLPNSDGKIRILHVAEISRADDIRSIGVEIADVI
jgi:hypothetical protein